MRATWFVWCVVASVTWSTHATYSIVAINSTDGAVGAAAASCSGKSRVLSNLYAAIPGHGAVVTQGHVNMLAQSRAARRVREAKRSASEIIDEISSLTFDPDYCDDNTSLSRHMHETSPRHLVFCGATSRQYGVVTSSSAASFTGRRTLHHSGDRQGIAIDSWGHTLHYAVQGTMLTSEKVLESMSAAFEQAPERADVPDTLEERLLAALTAGGDHGQGDARCAAEHGIPADSAMMRVDEATGKGIDRGEHAEFNGSSYRNLYHLFSGPLLREQVEEAQDETSARVHGIRVLFDSIGCEDHSHDPLPELERLMWLRRKGGSRVGLVRACHDTYHLHDFLPSQFEHLLIMWVAISALGVAALLYACWYTCFMPPPTVQRWRAYHRAKLRRQREGRRMKADKRD